MSLAARDRYIEAPEIERVALRWALLFYCVFTAYGGLIPFRFTADSALVQSQWSRFFAPPFLNGVRQFSLPDLFSNILLFIPFGFLWVGSDLGKRVVGRLSGASLALAASGLLYGFVIEVGQTFLPVRTASLLDALCNGVGAGLGGTLGYFVFRALRGRLGIALIALTRERPSLIVLALLTLALLADAYYPFQITIDVSAVWDNAKQAQIIPFARGLDRFWLELFVEKVIPFAAASFLLALNFRRSGSCSASARACGLSIIFALGMETAKLFFAGRAPSADNFILSSAGALLGVLVVPLAVNTAFLRNRADLIFMAAAFLATVYAELSPFVWVSSGDELEERLAMIEWLPFSSYYGADPQSAGFDLLKKLVIVAPLGFMLAKVKPGNRWWVGIVGVFYGAALETCQIALQSRTPSVTDVLLFGIAAWTGAVMFERFSQIKEPEKSRDDVKT